MKNKEHFVVSQLHIGGIWRFLALFVNVQWLKKAYPPIKTHSGPPNMDFLFKNPKTLLAIPNNLMEISLTKGMWWPQYVGTSYDINNNDWSIGPNSN